MIKAAVVHTWNGDMTDFVSAQIMEFESIKDICLYMRNKFFEFFDDPTDDFELKTDFDFTPGLSTKLSISFSEMSFNNEDAHAINSGSIQCFLIGNNEISPKEIYGICIDENINEVDIFETKQKFDESVNEELLMDPHATVWNSTMDEFVVTSTHESTNNLYIILKPIK